MDAASELNFDSICRTCMHVVAEEETFAATTTDIQCHSIYDTVTEYCTMRIVDLLSTTAPQLQFIFSDELPQKICRECLQLLLRVYRFQQMCIQSEQQMREILAKRYPDVKLILTGLLMKSTADIEEFSMGEAMEGEIEAEAVNNALEVPLANDPLQNTQFLKMEEFIDEDECNGGDNTHAAFVAETNLFDPSLIIEVGKPTRAHELERTSNEVSSKLDIGSDWTNHMPNFPDRKSSNCKMSDIKDQKERINEATPTHFCNMCNKSFSQRRFLNIHLKRHEKWEERKNLQEKPLKADQGFQIKCDISGKNLVDTSVISKIGATTHESGPTWDEVSSYCTSDMPNFCAGKDSNCKTSNVKVQKEQISEAFSTPTHSCNKCNKKFSQRRFLNRHLKRHEKWEEAKNMPVKPLNTDERIQIKCDICGRGFNKPESLHKHKQNHTDQLEGEEKKIYACDLCENTYSSKRTLAYHKQRRHFEGSSIAAPTRLVCEFCNKGFQFRAGLVDHLRTHTGEKPFLCSLCGKSFKSSGSMKQHLVRHSGVKRFECPDCPKKFACSCDLSKHRVIHRLVKPHNCGICGASFAKSYQFKTHQMYHSGEKPYKCEYCDMRFVLMDKQRRHMRTHTGEKPYKCKYCERAFAQSNDLVKHLRNHLGDNVYKCELCPSAFRLASELRSHFASHRNDDEETRTRNMLALKEEDASLRLNLRSNGCLSITNG
ncbi:PREDICTED: zinc finger protein 708-like isoform X1 [Rhagoletis zephyria]|uniref:zinc finger protein 708-like isoform X1 n=1 Tax=Rhagoletis zephyria TaxID=28612 RepID=UPI0008118F1D|nr:PREDICTED: zinc finger protein 708-like isoform X1 [Rhagoletis zephyria]